MAETTDHPPDPKGLAAPLPAAPALAPDEAPKSYSSLSLLAVSGLGAAVLYALVVGVGGAIALFNRTPWVLPLWSLAVPVAAVVLCWAARVRIQNSEGALTGARLAVWGVWLSLVVGLLYAAYYSACYLSITQMAGAVADEWFDDLKNDRIDKAFLLGLPPPRPADNAGLRARLELEFDRGPDGSGQLSLFRGSQFVRQIEQGGTATQVQLLGVKDWDSVPGGGYEVQLTYRVSTPYLSSEVVIPVVSVNNADDSGGRQWYVKTPQTASPAAISADGRRMIDQMNAARTTAPAWIGKLGKWNWDQAYLETLPPAERERLSKERGPKFDEGLKAFRDGGLVRADPAMFWAGDKDRDAIIGEMKGLFGRGGASPDRMVLSPAPPTYQREPDRTRIGFDLTVPLTPRYLVHGRLMVTADGDDPSPTDWRIESLDLISGKSMAASGAEPPPGGSGASTP